jgi:hypothetical protein
VTTLIGRFNLARLRKAVDLKEGRHEKWYIIAIAHFNDLSLNIKSVRLTAILAVLRNGAIIKVAEIAIH